MKADIYIISFQLTVFAVYIAAIWRKYGVLGSISESWYVMGRDWKWLFTTFLYAIALPMTLFVGDYQSGWFFGSASCLCFTGAAAAYKQRVTDTVHGVGAFGGIIFALVGLLAQKVVFPLILFASISVLFFIFRISNRTWWIEIAAFACIEAGLIYLTF